MGFLITQLSSPLTIRRAERNPASVTSVRERFATLVFPACRLQQFAAVVDGAKAQEIRARAQLLFNPQKLVVLGDAVGAAGRAGLDLAHAGSHRSEERSVGTEVR